MIENRTVAFHTLGCKVNQYDTQAMRERFEEAGFRTVDFEDRADVYVVNTCTVTGTGDKKSMQTIRRCHRNNPDAAIVVTGCLAQRAADELKLPDYLKQNVLDKNHLNYEETTSLEEAIPDLDILYMTRVQKERFFNEEDYLRLKDSYILTPEKLVNAKSDLSILHPLPRVNEISVAVDDDPRACYFRQVKNGKFIRMALIQQLLAWNA